MGTVLQNLYYSKELIGSQLRVKYERWVPCLLLPLDLVQYQIGWGLRLGFLGPQALYIMKGFILRLQNWFPKS